MLVLALEGHRDQWDRIWCVPFVRPASSGHRFFSQSIPPSKTKYRLIAFRARVRPVRGSLSEGGARLIREATLFSENPRRKTRFDRLRTPNPELRTPNPKLRTPNSKPRTPNPPFNARLLAATPPVPRASSLIRFLGSPSVEIRSRSRRQPERDEDRRCCIWANL